MKRIKVIAFDLDDTLWDSKPVLIKAEQCLDNWLAGQVPELKYNVTEMRELRSTILEENPELVHRITELRRRVIEKALRLSGVDPHDSKALSYKAMDVFLRARNQITLPPETVMTVQTLAREFVLGSLTNGNADIHSLGLSQYFSFAYAAEDVGASKPSPDLFQAALRHTDCEPREMVYVGDDPVLDIDPANAVGLYTVRIDNSNQLKQGQTNPDEIITQIAELPGVIQRLQARN